MGINEALDRARKMGLDLVEIVPNASPPVVKIISFDKYRYQKDKQERKERKAKKTAEMKRVQISVRASQNDLLVKQRQLEKFISNGHPVEIYVRLRGREKRNKDWTRQKLEEFLKMITLEYKISNEPRFGGGGLSVQILPKKESGGNKQDDQKQENI